MIIDKIINLKYYLIAMVSDIAKMHSLYCVGRCPIKNSYII